MERCPFQSIRFCFKFYRFKSVLFASYHGTVFDAGIPAETPDLASYRKRAVCEDWMVGAPALEPGTRRPLCATSGPPLYRRTADHASALANNCPQTERHKSGASRQKGPFNN